MVPPVMPASNGDRSETETTSSILASVKEQVGTLSCACVCVFRVLNFADLNLDIKDTALI